MTKFDKEKYSLSVGESDLERMTMLGEIYMPYCADFLFENGLAPGLQVADIGCGPGNVSLWLAEQVATTGKVVSIDNSDEQLAILNKRILENEVCNISTYKTDIYEIDQIKECFDLIFCRFLFIHLSHPLLAIQKLKKLLKPGGYLIIAELDNSTWFSYPESKALLNDTALLCKVGIQKGADFCIGPKLFGYLRQENFNSINVKIAQPVLLDIHRDYLILKCKAWANTYLEYNLISSVDLESMIEGLYDITNNSEYLLAGAKMYLTCGKNPQH